MMTNDLDEWKHKEEWRKNGSEFCVVVSRHLDEYSKEHPEDGRGENRWCVYAYIYPNHPHFTQLSGISMFQPAVLDMPFHWGASLVRTHVNNEGATTSYQIGADYNHLHDQRYTYLVTREDARAIFHDAETLWRWLDERKGE